MRDIGFLTIWVDDNFLLILSDTAAEQETCQKKRKKGARFYQIKQYFSNFLKCCRWGCERWDLTAAKYKVCFLCALQGDCTGLSLLQQCVLVQHRSHYLTELCGDAFNSCNFSWLGSGFAQVFLNNKTLLWDFSEMKSRKEGRWGGSHRVDSTIRREKTNKKHSLFGSG